MLIAIATPEGGETRAMTDDEIADHAAMSEAITFPITIRSQDLMAQLTDDDATKIRAAVNASVPFWRLWSALQAQDDPMIVTNDRFKQGWAGLTATLGKARMNDIARAIGADVLIVPERA